MNRLLQLVALGVTCGAGVLAGTALSAGLGDGLAAGARVAPASPRGGPSDVQRRRCRFVKRRVGGKLRRVRVCRRVRPPVPALPPRPPAPPAPPPLPAGARIATTVRLDPAPGQVAVGEGGVWVKGVPASVTRIDPATGQAVATIPIGAGEFGYVTTGEGSVWATNNDANTVSRIDPATNTVVATIPVRANPQGVTTGFGAVWVVNHRDDSISRIDPGTNQVVATIDDLCCNPQAITAAAGSVWVGLAGRDQVARIDPLTNSVVALIPVAGACGRFAFDGSSLWLTACEGFEVSRIDIATSTAARVSLGEPAVGTAFWAGSVWFVLPTTGTVARVDPATGAMIGRLSVPGALFAGAGPGGLWVTVGSGRAAVRLEPIP